MKTLWAIIVLLVLVTTVAVVIAVSGGSDESKPLPAASAAPVGSPVDDSTSTFLTLVKKDIPLASVLSDDQLVDNGKKVCGGLHSVGHKLSDLELGVYINSYAGELKGTISAEEAATFVGYSVAAFCPQVYGSR